MQAQDPKASGVLSVSFRNSIIVIVFGVLCLLGIMQWTAYAVREHVRIASVLVFPATLESQKAGYAFARMNREYENAVVMQEKKGLDSAGQQAAAVVSALNSAGASMEFNPERRQQIASLQNTFADLQLRSRKYFSTAAEVNAVLPKREDLAALSRDNHVLQAGLEHLQNNLAADFTAELAVINKLQRLQGILEGVVFVGVILALYFSVRSLIDSTIRRREDEILHQVHSAQVNERNMLRALIDNIPDFMYVKDLESRFVVANPHLARVVGVKTPEDLQGKTDFDFYPRELATAFYEDEQNVIRSGQPLYNREEKGIDSDGSEVDVLTTKVPIFDSKGQVIGIAGVGRDITARKKMEYALREAELKYRGIFDKAIIGIYQSTPDGHLLNVNPSMAFAFGYASPEEMVDSITDFANQLFVTPKRGVEFMLVMDKVGGVKNFECEMFCKDGHKIWITMSIRAIREKGVVVRYEGMCEDCTERNMLREQLHQAQKLESVGQLAAGIAHEINTPIQYVGDNVRFLKDSFQDLKGLLTAYDQLYREVKSNALNSEAIQKLETAIGMLDTDYLLDEIPKAIEQTIEGVDRVSSLVGAMKEFSHPGTKQKIPLDINHAIENTITVARNEWKYVADLETDFDLSMPLIPCLPGEFNQVILNLIVNSAHSIGDVVNKGGAEKGKIFVQTKNCLECAEIRIQDTGSGIPEDVRARIFDPFFTTKEIGKGTGQGLAIARSVIVDKHGGSIHFETEEGQGTTFVIRLPHNGKALTAKVVTA